MNTRWHLHYRGTQRQFSCTLTCEHKQADLTSQKRGVHAYLDKYILHYIHIHAEIHAHIFFYCFVSFCSKFAFKVFSIFCIFFSLLKGFSLHTIYMCHRLTECLGCGPEHKASWQRQANLSSPLEGGLSRNKATRKLQQSSSFIYLFSPRVIV